MTKERMHLLMKLADELYDDEQEKSGMLTPQPFAWIFNKDTGQMLVVSRSKTVAADIAARLCIPQMKMGGDS